METNRCGHTACSTNKCYEGRLVRTLDPEVVNHIHDRILQERRKYPGYPDHDIFIKLIAEGYTPGVRIPK